jgi:hypothetical protein
MNRLEIDEKNMYAIVEPYVSHAQLHAEAIKRGLHMGTPEAGSLGADLVVGDSLDDALRSMPRRWETLDRHSPPVLDHDHCDWLLAYDFCHFASAEIDFPHEKTEEICQAVLNSAAETIAQDMEEQVIEFTTCVTPANRTGLAYANLHLILSRIKKALDPHNVANPTRFIDMEKMEKAERLLK